MNLDGGLIGPEDPARLVAYYTKRFGEPTWDEGGDTGWMLGQGAVTVGPHSEVKGRNAEPGRVIWNVETPDVRGTFERFKGAGAAVVQEPYTMEGMEADDAICTFEDPDGNYFQLMTPMGPPEA
jgi:predicted enzyme related to lactoylglutathione lyase